MQRPSMLQHTRAVRRPRAICRSDTFAILITPAPPCGNGRASVCGWPAAGPAGISGSNGKIHGPERCGVRPAPPGWRPRSDIIRPVSARPDRFRRWHKAAYTHYPHLRGAGFIRGSADGTAASYQQPTHSSGGLIGFEHGVYNLSGHVVVFGALPGNIDQRLEDRGDDGSPSAGSIQGHGTQTAYNVATNYDLAFRF
jgi:hypothetical protein